MGSHDFGFLSEIRVETLGNCSFEVSYTENIIIIYISYELCELYLVRDSQADRWCARGKRALKQNIKQIGC